MKGGFDLGLLPKKRLPKHRLGALLLLAINLFYAFQIPDIQELPVDKLEAMNARSLPWVLCIAGGIFSALLWFYGATATEPTPASAPTPTPTPTPTKSNRTANLLVAAALLVWTALFGWLLGVIGFGPSVGLFLLVGFRLLGEPVGARSLTIAIGVALVFLLLLRIGLGLHLPVGSLWLSLGWLSV